MVEPQVAREDARREQDEIAAANEAATTSPHVNSAASFFLADRSMAFYFVGASLFASNVGSEHFVGQAGDGARRGIAVALYEWYATFLLIALGWVFAPIYARAQIYTTPEFLERRFNKHCRTYLSLITCVMYVVTKMSASIYGGAVILSSALGWDLYVSAGACIVLSAMYTLSGGLRAVMYTDFIQTIVFVTGGMIVMVATLAKVGGLSGLRLRLEQQGREDFWTLLKPTSDQDYPWTGMLIGQPIGSLWYWCMDQDLVQRTLSAESDVHSKAGCVMASALKLLAPFFMVVPGMAVSVLFDFSAADAVSTDQAYPVLLTAVMPPGVVGIMVGSIMTAMMSSLDSVFNAGSTVFTFDIYARLCPGSTDAALQRVGRAATVGFAVLSFLWIPVISGGDGLYRQVVELQAYLTPPVGIVLLLGVLWRRINGPGGNSAPTGQPPVCASEVKLGPPPTLSVASIAFVLHARLTTNKNGALTGLLVGGGLGLTRMAVTLLVPKAMIATWASFWNVLFTMNFQHYAILLWVTSGVACVAVSFGTGPPHRDQVERLTVRWGEVWSGLEEEEDEGGSNLKSWVRPALWLSVVIIFAATLSVFFVFR